MGIRRKGREVALQTLYALSFQDIKSDSVQTAYLEIYQDTMLEIINDLNIKEGSKIINFSADIMKNLIPRLEDIDQEIKKYSDNWSLENIANVDKCILRIAVFELLYTDTPAPVIMNEAIEISKKFSSESSGKFINGILNAVTDGKK
jgi:transcription antitermination protein NusB